MFTVHYIVHAGDPPPKFHWEETLRELCPLPPIPPEDVPRVTPQFDCCSQKLEAGGTGIAGGGHVEPFCQMKGYSPKMAFHLQDKVESYQQFDALYTLHPKQHDEKKRPNSTSPSRPTSREIHRSGDLLFGVQEDLTQRPRLSTVQAFVDNLRGGFAASDMRF